MRQRKPAVKLRAHPPRLRVWSVYWKCGDFSRLLHQIVEMSSGKRSAIVKVHETFDHLGAAEAYERSLRAFLKEQARVRAAVHPIL